MNLFKLTLTALALATASVASAEPADFMGKWSLKGGSSVMTISKSGFDTLDVKNTYLDDLYQMKTKNLWANVDGDTMTIGKGAYAKTYQYDQDENHLIAPSGGIYVSVPDDWQLGNTFPGNTE